MLFHTLKPPPLRSVATAMAASMILLTAVTAISVGDAHAEPSTDLAWMTKLDEAARQTLATSAQARGGVDTIDLLVATGPDTHDEVERVVKSAGGIVHGTDADLDYLRVTLPQTAVDDVVGQDDVVAADLDHLVPLPDPAPLAMDTPNAVSPPGTNTPAVNPYLPSEEIGAVTFAADHPLDPARPVRVGVVDTGVDIAHPGLLRAGQPVTQLWTTTLRPGTDDDPSWVRLDDEVTTDDQGHVTLDAGEYHTPHEGTFRVGYLTEADQGLYGEDLDGNGATRERLPVLVDGDTVWTDPDGDHDFTTTPPAVMGGTLGTLRVDDPDTAINDSLMFVAESAEVDEVPYVHLGFDQVGHGTHVAGIIAGNALYGSQANGVAPNADIYSVQVCYIQGCPTGAMADAVALLARVHDVDVVNISVGGLSGLNDGHSAAELVYTRIAEEYDTVLTFSAGNDGNGTNTLGSPAAADSVLAVGASISAETWHEAYGVDAHPGVFIFSSRGLREDGALAPQVIAPGAAVSTLPVASTPAGPGAGYGLKNGTSMSSPMAAGAAALLVGAAQMAGMEPSAAEVRAALVSGARHLDGENVTSEGAGRIDLEQAWQILRQGQAATLIQVDAPVCTPYSNELTVPGRGVGLHQRCATTQGGPTPGHHDYTVTLTRTSGDQGDRETTLRWRTGDDRLTLTTTTVQLPLNTPVKVTISTELAAGTHLTGLLEIDDPNTGPVDQFLPVSITVGHQLDATTLTWSGEGNLSPGQSDHYWVEVPPGTALNTVTLSETAEAARLRVVAFWPSGVPATDEETSGCYTDDQPDELCQPFERTFEEYFPGIWEVIVQGSPRAPAASPYTIQLRSDTSSARDTQVVLPSTPVGSEHSFETSFANSAGISSPTAFAPLVSENRYERCTLHAGDSAEFEFTVPDGVPYISGRAQSLDDAGLDIHASRNGEPLGHSDGVGLGEFQAFTSPGDVIHVTVTATWVHGETTEIWYEDRLHRPWADRRASVSITDVTTTPPAPDVAAPSWTATTTRVNGTITVLGDPVEGRVLGTTVRLRLGESLQLAQTSVRFAPATVPLDINSGLADATGAQYTVYEGDTESGVEVTQLAMEGTGIATVEPALAPWPVFDPALTYTVVQTNDPDGSTANEKQVTARLVDGRLVATFTQIAAIPGAPTPTPTPTDQGTTGPGGSEPTSHTDQGHDVRSEQDSHLAWTGPTMIIAIIILAGLATTTGVLLRRRASKPTNGRTCSEVG